MNVTNTIINAVRDRLLHSTWCDMFDGFKTLLSALNPGIPDDGTQNFIAFDAGDGKPRMKLKTTRFLTRKLQLNKHADDAAISAMAAEINADLFVGGIDARIDRGKDIARNYRQSVGGNSCMTGSDAPVGLYADNPDCVSQLIMESDRDSARALLWRTDGDILYLDRVYSTCPALSIAMYEWAEDYGIRHYKDGGRPDMDVLDLIYEDGQVPYMDTFHYGTENCRGNLDISNHQGRLDLNRTDGWIGDHYHCAGCGRGVDEGDVLRGADDEDYCEDCYYETFSSCEHCGTIVYQEDAVRGYSLSGYEQEICSDCASRHYVQCKECGDYFHPEKTITSHDGDDFCMECSENEGYAPCTECNDYFQDLDNDGKCADCAGLFSAVVPTDGPDISAL